MGKIVKKMKPNITRFLAVTHYSYLTLTLMLTNSDTNPNPNLTFSLPSILTALNLDTNPNRNPVSDGSSFDVTRTQSIKLLTTTRERVWWNSSSFQDISSPDIGNSLTGSS